MTQIKPICGSGHFQWNAGGWFGSLVGGTAYLAVGGIAFLVQQPVFAAIWFACFAVSIAAGSYLWTCRGRIAPYPAIQGLILVCGLSAAVAILSLLYAKPELVAAVNLTPAGGILLLLMFPAMMWWFHILEKSARRTA